MKFCTEAAVEHKARGGGAFDYFPPVFPSLRLTFSYDRHQKHSTALKNRLLIQADAWLSKNVFCNESISNENIRTRTHTRTPAHSSHFHTNSMYFPKQINQHNHNITHSTNTTYITLRSVFIFRFKSTCTLSHTYTFSHASCRKSFEKCKTAQIQIWIWSTLI